MSEIDWKQLFEISKSFKEILTEHAGTPNFSDILDGMGMPNQVMIGINQMTVPDAKVVGPAVTLRGVIHRGKATKSSGFNYIMDARAAARKAGPGVVFIYATHDANALSLGECQGTGLAQVGIQAAITDAGVRDTKGLALKKFPVWARQITPRSAGKGRVEYVEAMCPVQCNNVQIRPGDIIVGDSDGVVVVPSEVALEVQKKLTENYKRGEYLLAEIDKGTDYPEAIKKLANLGGVPDWFK